MGSVELPLSYAEEGEGGGRGEERKRKGSKTHRVDDRREEKGEGVERAVTAHVDDGVEPGLPVEDRGPEVLHPELLVLGGGLLVGLQASYYALAVHVRQERGLVGEVEDHPKRRDADQDGREPFEDEDPSPPALAADPAHVPDRGREQATEGARDGGGGEEDGGADAELVPLVPAGEVVVDAGEQAGLGEPEEEARGHEALEVVDEPHGRHANAPEDHDDGDEDAGAEALEQDVGEGLGERVGDEEDGQGCVVLAARDA